MLSLTFLGIKKEDRPGQEVAEEILQNAAEEVKQMKETMADFIKYIMAEESNEVHSTLFMMLGAFMPLALELCSETLKNCTPNMKKKKD